MQKRISYTTDGVANVIQAELELNLDRSQVPTFCKAARIKIEQLLGASFYYPDVRSGKNFCRYEWLVSEGRRKYVWRYGFMFSVGNENLRTITAYFGYGDAHPQFGKTPSFSAAENERHLQSIITTLEAIDREATAPEESLFHLVTYVEMPHETNITSLLTVKQLGLTIFPTILFGKDNKRVSAFIFTIPAPNRKIAKGLAWRRNLWACSLLTLATESVFNTFYVQWGKKRQPVQFLGSLSPPPSNADLYPPGSWNPFESTSDPEFLDRLEKLLNYYEAVDESLRSSLRNAIYAYRAGRDLTHKHPTLASVAFVAALSIFAQRQRCEGQLTCSIHGSLQNFRHDLVGERGSILNRLVELHNIEQGSESFGELDGLLERMYSKQRSAFVHSAILRHNEASEQNILTVEPAGALPYAKELLYSNDLISMDSLCRRSLLTYLARSAQDELNVALFKFDKFKVYRQHVSSAHVSLPKNTWVNLGHLNRQ